MRGTESDPVVAGRSHNAIYWSSLGVMIVALVVWQWAPIHKPTWEYDEGINMMKAQLVLGGHTMYEEIWSDQPPLFTMLLAGAFAFFGSNVAVARVLVVAMAAVLFLAVALLGRQLGGRWVGLGAAVLLALSPHFQLLSGVVLIGLPAIGLGVLSLVAGLAFHNTGRSRWLALAGLLFGLSMLTKPITAPFYLPLSALAIVGPKDRKAEPWTVRARRWWVLNVAPLALLGLSLVVWRPGPFLDQTVGTFFDARSSYGFSLQANIATIDLSLQEAYYPGLVLLSLVGLATLAVDKLWRRFGVMAIWHLGCIFAILFHSPQRWHEHLLVMPSLAVLGSVGGQQVVMGLRRASAMAWPRRLLTLAAVASLALTLAAVPKTILRDLALHAEPLMGERQAAASADALVFLESQVPAGSPIITDEPMLAFKSGCTVPPLVAVPSFRRIRTGGLSSDGLIALTQATQPSAIVFWEQRLYRLDEYVEWVKARYALSLYYPERWIYVPPDITWPQSAVFQDEIALLGSSIERLAVQSGGVLHVRLFWQAQQRSGRTYTCFVHMLDNQGNQCGQADADPFYSTSKWHEGDIVVQDLALQVQPDAPAGEKLLSVGWYDRDRQRLPLTDDRAAETGVNQVVLVERPVVRWEENDEVPAPTHSQEAELGGYARLLGYDLSANAVPGGGSFALKLYWQCIEETNTSYTVFVHVLDDNGKIAAQRDQIPGAGRFPTTGWLRQEVISDVYEITLPDDLASGTYHIALGMYDLATGARLPVVEGGQPRAEGRVLLNTPISVDR